MSRMKPHSNQKKEPSQNPQMAISNRYFTVAAAATIFFIAFFYYGPQNLTLVAIMSLTLIGVVINYLVLRRTRNYKIAPYVLLSMGGLIMFCLFIGGWENMGLVWPFAWLPATFWMIKEKKGRVFLYTFVFGSLLLTILSLFRVIYLPYSQATLVNFNMALIVFGVLMIFYQNASLVYQDELHSLKEELANLNLNLERKVEERTRELLNLTSKLNKAQKTAHLGSWELDFSTGVATWSEESCRIYGLSPSDNIHSYENWLSFVHPDDLENVLKVIEESQATLSPSSMHHRIVLRDGTVKHLYSESFFEMDDDGKPIGIYGIAHDITTLKIAEEEIHQLNISLEEKVEKRTLELKEVNTELESFSYSVSHDLRAPLRAVNGYAKILQEDYGSQLNEEAGRIIKKIMDSAKKMGQLIDDLLTYSRLGRKELVKSVVNMHELVTDICNEIENEKASKKIHFTIKELVPAEADRAAITQVWVNLISNAVKYSRHNDLSSIEIGSHEKGNELIYYVKDNGVGFDMSYSDKLFGVFQRLHSEEEFEGTGVGLAIVHRIIRKHKGRIWATSELNQGSEFYFSLNKNNNHEEGN